MQRMIAMGSGSSGTKGATGKLSVSTTSDTKTINTELSSISKFILYGVSTNSSYQPEHIAILYDSSVQNKYYGVGSYNGNVGKVGLYDFSSSAQTILPTIKSVSGGTVEIITTSGGNWATMDWYWVAVE